MTLADVCEDQAYGRLNWARMQHLLVHMRGGIGCGTDQTTTSTVRAMDAVVDRPNLTTQYLAHTRNKSELTPSSFLGDSPTRSLDSNPSHKENHYVFLLWAGELISIC